MSLWAAVPHYVQLAPSPPAAKALCERLAGVLGTEIDVSELDEASREYVDQVSQAVATDAETASYVEDLEHRADSLDWLDESDALPSGDALAAEIPRFLREREDNGDAARVRRARLSGVFDVRGDARRFRRLDAPRLRRLRPPVSPSRCGRGSRLRAPACACAAAGADFRAVSFGAGGSSASAFAISEIVPSSSRAGRAASLARGV